MRANQLLGLKLEQDPGFILEFDELDRMALAGVATELPCFF